MEHRKPNRFVIGLILLVAGAALGYGVNWLAFQVYHARNGLDGPLVLTQGPLFFFKSDNIQLYGPAVLFAFYGLVLGLLVGTHKTAKALWLFVAVHVICTIYIAVDTKFFVNDMENLLEIRLGLLWIGAWLIGVLATSAAAWYAIHRDET